jgi:hypothetical protein
MQCRVFLVTPSNSQADTYELFKLMAEIFNVVAISQYPSSPVICIKVQIRKLAATIVAINAVG